MKHTPGPWLRDGRTVFTLQETGNYRNGEPLRENRFTMHVQLSRPGVISDEELEANARIAQAAPKMYEALVQIMNYRTDFRKGSAENVETLCMIAEEALEGIDGH